MIQSPFSHPVQYLHSGTPHTAKINITVYRRFNVDKKSQTPLQMGWFVVTEQGTHSPAAFTQWFKIQVLERMMLHLEMLMWCHCVAPARIPQLKHFYSLTTYLPMILSTHFFSFFCAAFFFTSCNRFMALSWDSWDVGALSPAAAFAPLPLFPLPPPLLPPFPPVLAW